MFFFFFTVTKLNKLLHITFYTILNRFGECGKSEHTSPTVPLHSSSVSIGNPLSPAQSALNNNNANITENRMQDTF